MLLRGEKLSFKYGNRDYIFKDVNICIKSGERIGLVAKSGYGKSTLAQILGGYLMPTSGQVLLKGEPIPQKVYNPIQLIYQHPEKAINPRWKMLDVLEESGGIDHELIKSIGIEEDWLTRYPRELSSGELQRFAVARALNGDTKFLIADEISTMLDVITQAQIWNLILKHVEHKNLGLIVITHNHHLLNRVCTRIVDLEKENQYGK